MTGLSKSAGKDLLPKAEHAHAKCAVEGRFETGTGRSDWKGGLCVWCGLQAHPDRCEVVMTSALTGRCQPTQLIYCTEVEERTEKRGGRATPPGLVTAQICE